jgi:hypothetical protein
MNNILKITVLSFMATACLPAITYASDNEVIELHWGEIFRQ